MNTNSENNKKNAINWSYVVLMAVMCLYESLIYANDEFGIELVDNQHIASVTEMSTYVKLYDQQDNYDLLIVAPEAFEYTLEPLVEHKNATGIPTHLMTLESIEEEVTGTDAAERIKLAIAKEHELYGVTYVMLVGDSDRLPVRYIRALNTEWGTRFYPSDLYFADLYDDAGNFDDWDFNNDGFFGTSDFSGGADTAKVNLDRVNLRPDIAVGRVPASDNTEVARYVEKVIRYEMNAWRSTWLKRALVISDHGTNGAFSDATTANVITSALKSYQVKTHYRKDLPYLNMSQAERAQEVADEMDEGLGFVSHLGHGNSSSWAGVFTINDMNRLSNSETLPIMYSIGCDTAMFNFGRGQYRTTTGTTGSIGNNLSPALIQPVVFDHDSLAEEMLVKSEEGGIAYIGHTDKGEHGGKYLHRYFVQNLNNISYSPKLGLLWMNAMRTFNETQAQPGMGWYYGYIHQHKTMLFGDPSLRINGVSRIQKRDYLGQWKMVHDGWHGQLVLTALKDDPIESYYNIQGIYTDDSGNQRQVRGAVLTPDYPRGASWPDNKIEFWIDFNGNYDFSDDQKFVAYLFSWAKDEMAGTTRWGSQPFGVSISRPGKVRFDGFRDGIKVVPPMLSGSYAMEHDGWVGNLKLNYVYGAAIEQQPELQGIYVNKNGKTFDAYGHYDKNYPHRVALFVDFADTAFNRADDTKFHLYYFTQTKDGMAGLNYWHGRPFGARLNKLAPLSIVNLSGGVSQEFRYTVQVPNGTTNAVFEIQGGSGDADLYVRRGAPPSTTNWDYRPYYSGNAEKVEINSPAAGLYHIMVRGYSHFAGLTLKVTTIN